MGSRPSEPTFAARQARSRSTLLPLWDLAIVCLDVRPFESTPVCNKSTFDATIISFPIVSLVFTDGGDMPASRPKLSSAGLAFGSKGPRRNVRPLAVSQSRIASGELGTQGSPLRTCTSAGRRLAGQKVSVAAYVLSDRRLPVITSASAPCIHTLVVAVAGGSSSQRFCRACVRRDSFRRCPFLGTPRSPGRDKRLLPGIAAPRFGRAESRVLAFDLAAMGTPLDSLARPPWRRSSEHQV